MFFHHPYSPKGFLICLIHDIFHLEHRAPAHINLIPILPETPTQYWKDAMDRPTHSAERQAHPTPDDELW